MRIGFFSDVYFPRKDGACYTVETWKRELESRGHEVQLVYPGSEEYSPGENEIPAPSIPDPWYYGHRWPLPLGARKLPSMDIVHCHSPGPIGITGRYYAWKNNLPSIYTFHTPVEKYFEGFLGSKTLAIPLEKLFVELDEIFLRSFDQVTSNTGEIRNKEIDAREIPAGVDMDFFQPREESFVDELDVRRPIAGYSGRLSEEKNIDSILEMAENFDGTVLIVGNGREEEKLKKKGGENVVFMDYLPRQKLPEFYSGIDVLVHASEADTFSLTAMEANACGTPVVAPDHMPFDRVMDSRSGLLYPPGDISEFNRAVRKALGQDFQARESARRYSLDKTVDSLEKIYTGLE